MIETKSEKVAPAYEQDTINTLACFGWTLQSSQEINVKDSHIETKNGDFYNVTEVENYVKLVFQRDTAMANYNEIVDLERQYNSLPAPVQKKAVLLKIIGFVIGGLGILMCLGGAEAFGIICIILGIAALIWMFVKNLKSGDVYSDEMKVYNGQLNEIKNSARALVQ